MASKTSNSGTRQVQVLCLIILSSLFIAGKVNASPGMEQNKSGTIQESLCGVSFKLTIPPGFNKRQKQEKAITWVNPSTQRATAIATFQVGVVDLQVPDSVELGEIAATLMEGKGRQWDTFKTSKPAQTTVGKKQYSRIAWSGSKKERGDIQINGFQYVTRVGPKFVIVIAEDPDLAQKNLKILEGTVESLSFKQ